MKKFAIVGFIIISLTAVLLYLYLGGSSKPVFNFSENKFHFQGTKYNGSVESKKPQLLFERVLEKIQTNDDVFVAVINYSTQKEDSISQIIGMISENEMSGISIDSDTSMLLENNFVKAIINSHSVVMPNPEEVRNMAASFAKEQNKSLQSWSLELYRGERSLEVYFPTK